VMSVSTQTAATGGLSNFYISDGVNSNTITNSQTISFAGTQGVTTLLSGNNVTVSTDSTVLRSNTSLGGQHVLTVDTDLRITGNLFINGTTTQVHSSSLTIDDPIIYLAANNSVGNIIDIGFVAAYNAAGQYAHTGITRHAGDGKYYIFDSYTPEPQLTNIVDPTNASFRVASLVANVTGGTVSGLKQAIGVTDGGTGANTFTQYGITFGNGAGALGVTSAAGVNDAVGSNQILTVNSLGVPVWTTTLDGGMF